MQFRLPMLGKHLTWIALCGLVLGSFTTVVVLAATSQEPTIENGPALGQPEQVQPMASQNPVAPVKTGAAPISWTDLQITDPPASDIKWEPRKSWKKSSTSPTEGENRSIPSTSAEKEAPRPSVFPLNAEASQQMPQPPTVENLAPKLFDDSTKPAPPLPWAAPPVPPTPVREPGKPALATVASEGEPVPPAPAELPTGEQLQPRVGGEATVTPRSIPAPPTFRPQSTEGVSHSVHPVQLEPIVPIAKDGITPRDPAPVRSTEVIPSSGGPSTQAWNAVFDAIRQTRSDPGRLPSSVERNAVPIPQGPASPSAPGDGSIPSEPSDISAQDLRRMAYQTGEPPIFAQSPPDQVPVQKFFPLPPLQVPSTVSSKPEAMFVKPAEPTPLSANLTSEGQAVQRAVGQLQQSPPNDPKVQQAAAGCATCGRQGGLGPHDHFAGGRCTNCGGGDCVPGRKRCYKCESHTVLGGFMCDLYDCVCCPDPCYEPKWVPLADSAFFADGARPVSQSRFGWDSARNFILPDRSEFFWARADGSGLGPTLPAGVIAERKLRFEEMTMYTETALGGFSTFIEFPYRSMDPEFANHAAGFGDMTVGTKSLLFDCELLLVTFQMKTIIPIGQSIKGLGTGHTTLEPSLLFAVKLSGNTYFQGQLAEWIPLGGNSAYQGSVFHSHLSLNHVLYRVLPDVPIVSTFEVNTWTFQDGAYTDPINGAFQKSSGQTYVSLGPGLRLFICDRCDFGVGAAFAVTEQHFAQTLVRTVFRYRF